MSKLTQRLFKLRAELIRPDQREETGLLAQEVLLLEQQRDSLEKALRGLAQMTHSRNTDYQKREVLRQAWKMLEECR